MRFSRVKLENWRNFRRAEVDLLDRAFVIGPNASGKSNFLDVFRFLHDLVVEGGGLSRAVDEVRGGLRGLRCLNARQRPQVLVECDVSGNTGTWMYRLKIGPHSKVDPRAIVLEEHVTLDGKSILDRPTAEDKKDTERLTQTAIQQISANRAFRELAEFFRSVEYQSLVPQLIRESQPSPGTSPGSDPLGRDFLVRVADSVGRKGRLSAIGRVLKKIVPQFETLEFERDSSGRPHLVAKFKNWRRPGSRQRETQLSDGTLRLIAILWQMQESKGTLLLDEPEWSLHTSILRRLAGFLAREQRSRGGRQVIIATHSEAILDHEEIAPEEIIVIRPQSEGSSISRGADIRSIHALMERGVTAGKAAITTGDTLMFPQLAS